MYFKSLNFEQNIIHEIFENNYKKNCLPIDLTKTYNNKRIVCIDYNLISEFIKNTNLNTFISMTRKYFIINFIIFAAISIATLSFTGFYLVPLLTILYSSPFFIKMMIDLIRNKMYCAKKFFLFPILDNVEDYNMNIIKNEQEEFIKHPIISINDGEIIYVYDEIRNGEKYNAFTHKEQGNHVIISHNNGEFFSLYANMYHGIKVKIGDKINKGQCIGYIGNTGASNYPYLHFEIFYTIGTKDKKIKLTKSLSNFEDYMYTPINLEEELKSLSGKKTDINKLKDPLIKNTSGKIEDCCFIS